ncbi:MAG: 4Fe-4S dicluster domain-containing protein [Candidatus Thorarchaeota archaeon]|nr:4Fe-4S dicluster domain-containing protein [Candidatus Thorarchaeota archaeon]
MSVIELDPDLLQDIKKYGAFDVSACFNCGTCTAICPLSEEDGEFPRAIIRLAQLGAKEELIDSKELWLCYYCGQCSTTCPREAEPGEFMAAARRYAIAQNDVTHISRVLYKSKAAYTGFIALLSIVALWIMWPYADFNASLQAGINPTWIYFDPEFVHLGGLVAGGIFAVWMGLYFLGLFRHLMRQYKLYGPDSTGVSFLRKLWIWILSLIKVGFTEILYQRRYATDQDTSVPFRRRRWVLHMCMVWGFILLFASTVINWLTKPIELMVPITYPTHLLGITGGILLVYGATRTMIFHKRRHDDNYYGHTTFSDWVFLGLTNMLGISGFLLTIDIYIPLWQQWAAYVNITIPEWQTLAGYFIIFHLLIVGLYIVLAPLNKGAHAFYRPLTLWVYEYAKGIKAQTTPEEESYDEIPILT